MTVETVVIPNESNQETPEQQQALLDRADGKKPEPQEELLAGKYKTVDELTKAYKELEKRFHAGEHKKQDPEVKPEDKNEENTEGKKPETEESLEIKPEDVQEEVEKAGLDFEKYNTKFAEKGTLDEEDFSEIQEKMGLPRQMVETYLAGLKSQITDVRTSILNAAGGESGYRAMTEWAKTNLSTQEIETYNKALESDSRLLAVEGLYARYEKAVGKEGSLINGRSATGVTVFNSRSEMKTAMADPRYLKDPEYTRDVERRVALSSF